MVVFGFSRVEDKIVIRLVVVGGLVRMVMGVDIGVLLVFREVSIIGIFIVVDIIVCDRGKRNEKWVGCLRKLGR